MTTLCGVSDGLSIVIVTLPAWAVSSLLSNFRALASAASVRFSPAAARAAASVAVAVGVLSDAAGRRFLVVAAAARHRQSVAPTNKIVNRRMGVSSCQNRRPVRTSLGCPRSSR